MTSLAMHETRKMGAAPAKQLRHVFDVISGATPESGRPEYWDGDIRWLTPEDVSRINGYWVSDTRRMITAEGYDSCGTTIAPPGAIVLTKRAPIGQLAVLASEACSNQGCLLLAPRAGVDSRFYYYWLTTQSERLQALGRGSTFMELSADDLKALTVPVPPPEVQRAIADRLDAETARLDALVSAKERLLGLLAEKRRALVTRAVTRGLDAGAATRDSGVPWLGEIPKHWTPLALKHGFRVIASGTTPATDVAAYYDGDVPWITTAELRENVITSAARSVTRKALREHTALRVYEPGALLFAMYGATIGRVALLGVVSQPV